MADLEIPLSSESSHFDLTVDLESVTYRMAFNFNIRAAAWYVTISSETGVTAISGIPLLTNVDLLFQYQGNPGLPPGTFMALDTEGLQEDADRDNLGDRIKLIYQESS